MISTYMKVYKALLKIFRLQVFRKNLVNNYSNNFFYKFRYEYRRCIFYFFHPIRSLKMINLRKKKIESKKLSLVPFDKNKSIFVRIPKSAGRSISESLYGCFVGSHLSIRDYQIIYNQKQYNEYFKFSIVRNPWDRCVSAFYYLKGGGETGYDKKFKRKYLDNSDFHSFVTYQLRKKPVINSLHFTPQYKFICINDKIEMDYIGYFENLENEFSFLSKKLKIKNKDLIRLNPSSKRIKSNYREYYNKKTAQVIAEVYKKDIELFNYSF